jgi:hypothetical protein
MGTSEKVLLKFDVVEFYQNMSSYISIRKFEGEENNIKFYMKAYAHLELNYINIFGSKQKYLEQMLQNMLILLPIHSLRIAISRFSK